MTGADVWGERVAKALETIRQANRWREFRTFDASSHVGELVGVGEVVSFASNDYLGLANHPIVRQAATKAIERWGAGATASRHVVGSRPVHADLEDALADWKGCDRAVVFPSGYQANLGVLACFGGPAVTILSDELNHASIIDGCRLSRSPIKVYPHNDLEALGECLEEIAGPVIVVSDSVYSMDGDAVDVYAMAEVCGRSGALLVLDEAHSVLGPDFVPQELPCPVLRVGTLSKALGSQGGFVAGSSAMIELLVNRARPLIFTTGLAPSAAAGAFAALQIVTSSEGNDRRARLRQLVDRFLPAHPSPILPLIIGEEADAVATAGMLLDAGLLVPAIRPPTVPVGSSRLRIALCADHTDDEIERLVSALAGLGQRFGADVG